jgi:Kef-type K+ transport system membrane component KefB
LPGLESLLVVALVAALAPLIAAALPGPRVPRVVILILAGVLIGPHVLGLADTTGIRLLSNAGLGSCSCSPGTSLPPGQ